MAEATGIRVEELGLFTDLYQLTMAQSYLEHQKNRPATFSLIIRKYPPHHTYMVAAGLATVLEYLTQVHFSPEALAYLRSTGRLSEAFLTYLATWRFGGDVMALPDELLGNIGDDPFGASIELGRYAFPQWGDLCDLHRKVLSMVQVTRTRW